MGAKLVGVLMAAFAGVALPHTSWGEASPQVRVILLNDSVVPVDLAERAQAEVTRVYKLIGVEVVWVAEPPPDMLIKRASPDCCCQQLPRARSRDELQAIDLPQPAVELVPTREILAHHYAPNRPTA